MTTFDIDATAVLDLAAQKLADEIGSQVTISEKVDRIIAQRIDEAMKTIVNGKIDQIIDAQLEKMLNQTIQPVSIWGDKVGEPTTIASALSERAKEFWNTKVDSNGKVIAKDSYYFREAKTRAEYMLGKYVADEFAGLVKTHATGILAALKDKLREDAHASIDKHLNELIRVK
jgi:hypothetical protein